MTQNGIDSNQFDLFDELENGALIGQDILDSIEVENPELFEILQISNQLRSAKKVEPEPFFSRVSQIHIYYQLVDRRRPKLNPIEQIKYFISNLRYISPPSFSLKPAMTIILALILSFSFFVGGVEAADNARPGQFLYPVDLAIENVQLILTTNEESRISLLLSFAEERLEEAETEYQIGNVDHAEIALRGYQEAQQSVHAQLGNDRIGISEDLQNSAVASRQKNLEILTSFLETAPESSQKVILQAIQVSGGTEEQQPTAQEPPENSSGQVVEEILPDQAESDASPPLQEEEEEEDSLEQVEATAPPPEVVPDPTAVEEEHYFVTVWAYSVNVHSSPGYEYPVVGWLFQNQTITSSTCENGFLFIPEFSGWASGTCFTPNPCGLPGSCVQIWD